MTPRTVRSFDEFTSMATSWADLAANRRSPLLQPAWFISCARSLYDPEQLRIVSVVRDDRIVAVAPLACCRAKGFERYEIVGATALAELTGVLYEDEAALRELFDVVLARGRPVFFGKMEGDAAETRFLETMSPHRAVRLMVDDGSPRLTIDGTFDEFLAQMTSRRRSDLRRARRRAEADGPVSFEHHRPTPDLAASAVESFAAIEARSWKWEGGAALARTPRLMEFFRSYGAAVAAIGAFQSSTMRIGQKPVASMLGVEHSRGFWVLKIGYDEDYARSSPGVQLMHDAIRQAFDDGLESFEFLGRWEPWLRMWTEDSHPFKMTRLYPYSPYGLSALGQDVARLVKRRITGTDRESEIHR